MYASTTGYVGKDSEVITTKTGKRILKFSIAEDIFANGAKTTQWINCVDFRQSSCDKLVDYIKKGTLLFIAGELTLNKYERSDGTSDSNLQCVISAIKLHGNKNGDTAKSTSAATASAPVVNNIDADDIPF